MTYSNFLRTMLKLDALSCLGLAALLVPFAGLLSAPLGIPAVMLNQSGVVLVPIGLFIGWLGVRGHGSAALVWLVILGNLGWVAASFALAASLPGILPAGVAFVSAQALSVLSLAILEWRGIRQGSVARA